jgi:hypothetical protein
MQIESFSAGYKAFLNSVDSADEAAIRGSQEAFRHQLEELAKSCGLKGSFKIDPKWASGIADRKAQELLSGRIRALASRISGPESYKDAEVRQQIGALTVTPAKKTKEVGASMGHQVAGSKSEAAIVELLEKLTGISSVQTDGTLVATHLETLKSLYDRSVNSLPEGEIKAEVKQLKALPIPELARIAEGFGLDRPGKKKGDIIKRIENKITATYRAKVANQI